MKRFVDPIVLVIVPAATALTIFSLLITEQLEIDYDLQVTAPDRSRPGAVIPLRSLLLGHLRRVQGPELVVLPAVAQLEDGRGNVVVRARLRPSFAKTMEGLLVLPKGFEGRAVLRVAARLSDDLVTATAPLEVSKDPPPSRVQSRKLGPLNRFSAGPVKAVGNAQPPSALEIRVVGGVCVPEQRCDLLVRVGTPPASIEIAQTASVTPIAREPTVSEPTDGIVPLSVVTHGPEAELRLKALRESIVVAEREVRLPIDLATTSLRLKSAIVATSSKITFRLEDKREDSGCIVDAYHRNRWVFTGWSKDCVKENSLRFVPQGSVASGLWRIQARRDPFGNDSSAARLLYLRGEEQSDSDVLRAIAVGLSASHPNDDYLSRVAAQPGRYLSQGLERQAAYLFAADEQEGLIAPPAAVSSYPEAEARLRRHRNILRRFSLFALALTGVALGLLVVRRGLRAASAAREIMAAAGDDRALTRRNRLQMTLTVFSVAASILLTFLAIAVYLIARYKAF
ncbi:MAG: hypothetical protein JXA30_20760 [Deltaproteobacteria bacterium]|nr:hypothetical protein [Deltaproteobacteria bacterium]